MRFSTSCPIDNRGFLSIYLQAQHKPSIFGYRWIMLLWYHENGCEISKNLEHQRETVKILQTP